MPPLTLSGIFTNVLGWFGVERDSLGDGVSLDSPATGSIFETADRRRMTMAVSDEGGGGGGGPYRLRKTAFPSSTPAVIDLSGDQRFKSPSIDWSILSRPESRDFIVRHLPGLTYEDLRALFGYEAQTTELNLKNGIFSENASELLLLEMQANLGEGEFRLRTLSESQFTDAVSYLRDHFIWPIKPSYVETILFLDEHYDRLTELNPASDGDRIRYHQGAIANHRKALPLLENDLTPSDRTVSVGLYFSMRLIGGGNGPIPPRLSEIRRKAIAEQVRLHMPVEMRSSAHDRFIERVAWLVFEELRHMPMEEREAHYRDEIELRGIVLSAAAPEVLVLARMEGLGVVGHGLRSEAERILLSEQIRRRRESDSDDITRALARAFHIRGDRR